MTPRIAGLLAFIALIAAVLIFGPAACNTILTQKKAAKIDRGQSEATLDSLDIANRTEAERNALADEIEAQADELAAAVRAAPAGDSNDDADRAVCETRTYRETPRCVELLTRPKETPDVP